MNDLTGKVVVVTGGSRGIGRAIVRLTPPPGSASLPMNQILLRNRTVVGVEWATWITANTQHLARMLEVVLNRLARGVLHPPKPHLIPLDELLQVLAGPQPGSEVMRTVVVPT